MAFQIIRNDITKVSADAIVNSANPDVYVGRGVDSAIYHAAGPQKVRDARREIGPMMPGEAAASPAFDLDADYIIHTVGPVWRGGGARELELLADCYRNSLALAKELGCESIAFPLISTGTYGFPKDRALDTAVKEISSFLDENEMDIIMVVYDDEAFEISSELYDDVAEYISAEDIVPDPTEFVRGERVLRKDLPVNLDIRMLAEEMAEADADAEESVFEGGAAPAFKDAALEDAQFSLSGADQGLTIEEMLEKREETFQEYLFRLIDRKGMTDPEVYKKANLDRKLFSKIRSNVDYKPSKKTAVALAVALGLNFDETKDLLLRAGIALTRSNEFDIIIEFCLENRITNIFDINNILFKFNQPILGG